MRERERERERERNGRLKSDADYCWRVVAVDKQLLL